MQEKITQCGWEKLAICFIYICGQILLLASLLLTTTNIAVHTVFLIFAAIFYFVAAFKSPGIYIGKVQPNHDDVQMSDSKIQRKKNKNDSNQKTSTIPRFTIEQWRKNQQMQVQNQKIKEKQLKTEAKAEVNKNKTSLSIVKGEMQSDDLFKGCSAKAIPTQGKRNTVEQGKQTILSVARTVIDNFTNFLSKKQIDAPAQIPELNNQNSKKNIQKIQAIQKPQQIVKGAQDENGSQIVNQKQPNSVIVKENFEIEQINKQFEVDKVGVYAPKVEVDVPLQGVQKSIVKRLNNIKRYCRICQWYQPLRVKHCYSCNKCIPTFDHHCPWVGNCIGQKNKFYFLLYLLFQTLQFFVIIIDLIRFLSQSNEDNGANVGILLMSATLFFAILSVLFGFHLYLVANNITTWEFQRWEKIQYLCIFNKEKISSPFSKGIKSNFQLFWRATRVTENKNWGQQLSEDLSKLILRKPSSIKAEIQVIESDRRPFCSQRVI